MSEAPPPATTQAIVSDLANRLHAAVAGPARWTSRASAAEVSVVLEAWRLARAVLTEDRAPPAPPGLGLSSGEVRDIRDGAAADTCDVAGIRQEAEKSLYDLPPPALQPPADQTLAALIAAEQEALQRALSVELLGAHHCEALRTVAEDVCRVVRASMQQMQHLQDSERIRRAGLEALHKAEVAIERWLGYHEAHQRRYLDRRRRTAEAPPPESDSLATHMATDPALRCYVVALRRCFQLRRQQIRLEASLQRIQAACDALDRLQALRHCFPSLEPRTGG
jgi:hypothetical protein